MKWVTREKARVDRIACPWLIDRFIDREPVFLFVPAGEVMKVAEREQAIPYDVPDVELPEREDLKGVRIGVPKQMVEAEDRKSVV